MMHRDYEGSKIGMWLLLLTEVLFFGGLFILYAIYLAKYTHDFNVAGKQLNWVMGAVNTLVLLTSSMFAAMSVTAIQKGETKKSKLFLLGVIVLAFVFLLIKYFEWSGKFHHGIFPGAEHLLSLPLGEILFFNMYYVMTGLHGIHVIIGIVLFGYVYVKVQNKSVTSDDYIFLENSSLYWHLVDLVWIFLFPLFYLVI
jgi:cytochrome c oxidase subunit III